MIRDTSMDAYQSLDDLNAKQKKVLQSIKENQPCTDYQISLHLQWPINRVTPRRGELESLGVIVDSGKVKSPSGRMAHTWKIKPVQGIQLSIL